MSSAAPPPTVDPTAVVGRRLVAAVIDVGILAVFATTFWVLASRQLPAAAKQLGIEPCTGKSLCTMVDDRYVSGWPVLFLALVSVVYLVGVFVIERGLTGRTIGTMLTGLVTVAEDGRPMGVGPALVRSVAGIVDYVPCCLPLVGVVTLATTPGHRRVGDMAARSYVVGHEWFGRPVALPGPPTPAAPPVVHPTTIPASPPIPPAATPPAPSPMPFRPPEQLDVVGGPAPTSSPTGPPSGRGPVWDPDRRAYLQWDDTRQQWLQFDQASQRWHRYDHATGRWGPVDG